MEGKVGVRRGFYSSLEHKLDLIQILKNLVKEFSVSMARGSHRSLSRVVHQSEFRVASKSIYFI